MDPATTMSAMRRHTGHAAAADPHAATPQLAHKGLPLK